MGRTGTHKGFWWENQKERNLYEDVDVVLRIILRRILEKWGGVMWIGLMWLRDKDQWRTLPKMFGNS
jgi:hypothetical protein